MGGSAEGVRIEGRCVDDSRLQKLLGGHTIRNSRDGVVRNRDRWRCIYQQNRGGNNNYNHLYNFLVSRCCSQRTPKVSYLFRSFLLEYILQSMIEQRRRQSSMRISIFFCVSSNIIFMWV